jgi:hypothetical protein
MGFLFNIGSQQFQDGTTVWASAAIRARLVTTAAGAPSKDADVMTGIGSSDSACSVSVTGRTTPATSDARDRTEYSSNNVVFVTVPGTVGACNRMVFYRFVTNDADSIPLSCVDITEVTPGGGNVTVTMPTNGWFYTQQ